MTSAPGPEVVEAAVELRVVGASGLVRRDAEASETFAARSASLSRPNQSRAVPLHSSTIDGSADAQQHLARDRRLDDIGSVEAVHAVGPNHAVLAAEALRVGRPEEVDVAELILQLRGEARDVLELHPARLGVEVEGAVAGAMSKGPRCCSQRDKREHRRASSDFSAERRAHLTFGSAMSSTCCRYASTMMPSLPCCSARLTICCGP